LIVCGISGSSRVGTGSRRLATSVASRASSAVLTVPGDSPACALRRILLVVTEPEVTAPALDWAETLGERFGASISLVRLARAARGFWPAFGVGLREQMFERKGTATLKHAAARVLDAELALGAPLAPERDADSIATLAERESFDLVVIGLPHGSTQRTDPAAALVERLRRSSAVPTLSIRAPGPTLQYVPHSESRFGSTFVPAFEQSA
jgi:nucleotide-binding universal stress UspA family protein